MQKSFHDPDRFRDPLLPPVPPEVVALHRIVAHLWRCPLSPQLPLSPLPPPLLWVKSRCIPTAEGISILFPGDGQCIVLHSLFFWHIFVHLCEERVSEKNKTVTHPREVD